MGQGAVEASEHPRKHDAGGGLVEREGRPGQHLARSRRDRRSRASPAISRRRSSANSASQPATPRIPMAPDASCCRTSASNSCSRSKRLITTLVCRRTSKLEYALEGSIFIGGAVVQWLRDNMRFFGSRRTSKAGRFGAGLRQRGFGSRVHRPGRAPLGSVRERHAHRPQPRHRDRAHCAGGAGEHRVPGRGRHCDAMDRTPQVPSGVARRRRRRRERYV